MNPENVPPVICHVCERIGQKSTVKRLGIVPEYAYCMTPPNMYWDEDGKHHRHGEILTYQARMTCSNGHEFAPRPFAVPCWCGHVTDMPVPTAAALDEMQRNHVVIPIKVIETVTKGES